MSHVIRGVRFKRDADCTIVVTSTDPDVGLVVENCDFSDMVAPPGQRAVLLFPNSLIVGAPEQESR